MSGWKCAIAIAALALPAGAAAKSGGHGQTGKGMIAFGASTAAARPGGTASGSARATGFHRDTPPADPTRKVSVQDCSRPISADGGNLLCR
jgi:hypothetical protein